MPTDAALSWLIQLLLILSRISTMFVLSPVLGRTAVSNTAKIGLSLLTSLALINVYPPAGVYLYDNMPKLAGAVLMEMITGLVLGFGVILFFNIVYTAGQIIDTQIGFSMSQMFDPAVGTQVPVTGGLLNLVLMVCFLAADGITVLFRMMGHTFSVIPPGAGVLPQEIAYVALEGFITCFILAINIAMPLLASALLAEIALGIIVRTAPQMNVFVIGIPIKVIIGLIMLSMTIPVFVALTGNLFDMMYDTMDNLLLGMITT